MAKDKSAKAKASVAERCSATKERLNPGNDLRQALRVRQGNQRRVADIIGMPESKLSLILQGKQWATSAELAAIRKATASVCGA